MPSKDLCQKNNGGPIMARVTVAEVKQIIPIDATIPDADLDIYIISANFITDRVQNEGGQTDAVKLKEIERWLSAHYIAVRDMRSDTEKADVVSQKFQFKLGLNFNVTMFGQQALLLDETGTLAGLQAQAEGKGTATASLEALGPVPSSELNVT